MKFQQFTTDELREIASLIASRELITQKRHDILSDIYQQIIIELRERRMRRDPYQLKLD